MTIMQNAMLYIGSLSHLRRCVCIALGVCLPFLCIPVYAQTTSITIPYSFSFEESEVAELANWVINPGKGADTLPEKWIVGNAAHSEGHRALYISNNGSDCQFGKAVLTQYAYRDLLLPKGTYECSFDWRCVGKNGSSLYAGVFDMQTISTMTVGSDRAEIPSTVLSGCQLRDLYGSSRWKHSDFRISSNGSRVIRIYFIWMNRNAEDDLPAPIGGCVDNIQITLANCKKPSEVTADLVGDSMLVTWKGTSEKYILEYRRHGRAKWNTTTALYAESHVIEGLDEGSYDFRVRGVCNSVDTSAYAYLTSVLVYYPERHCIDFVHLEDNPAVVATYGPFKTPEQNQGVIDYGPDDKFSRHTVNIEPDVYDPRTDNRLSTIAPNGLASVRLGNWNTGAEAESLIFSYKVDENSAILLMHYAVVLEDPNHDPKEQPHFTLEILDQWGDLIEPTCGVADFYAGQFNGVNGWHMTARNISWKEWTTIGLNLSQRIGQNIYVRLTTRDCSLSGHYGYAYFSLDCVAARIEGTSCGSDAQMSIAAPDGFSYEWFDKYDEPVPADHLTNEGKTLLVESSDTTTYRCRLTYLEEASCGFDLYSAARPRFPVSSFDWKYEPAECQNKVRFINKSHIMTNFDNVVEYHYDQPCDEFEWDFGMGQSGSDRNPVVVFPQEGGTFDVTLNAFIAEGRCVDDTVISITLPKIGDQVIPIDTAICEGNYITLGPQYIFIPGEFENTWVTSVGCDSTVVMNVTVNPVFNKYVGDTTICADEKLIIDGQTYKYSVSDTFPIFNLSSLPPYCDSIRKVYVTVLDSILPDVSVREMSDEPNSGAIFIAGEGFDYYTVNDGYPVYATEDSITGLNGGTFELKFFNDFGCSVVVEKSVSVCMPGWVYQRWDDVLSLKNFTALETDSAEHVFTDYQWFKDNQPIEGDTLSYMYAEGGLDPNATYHLEMTRVINGEKVVTCPFRPIVEEDRIVVYVYPSPVQSGGKLTIMVSAVAKATIVNTFGEVVKTLDLKEGANEVEMNVPAGVYVVQVVIDGETRVCRVGVID